MSFLIETGIIKIENPFVMQDILEIEKVYITQTDKDSKYITKLEIEINELENKLDTMVTVEEQEEKNKQIDEWRLKWSEVDKKYNELLQVIQSK